MPTPTKTKSKSFNKPFKIKDNLFLTSKIKSFTLSINPKLHANNSLNNKKSLIDKKSTLPNHSSINYSKSTKNSTKPNLKSKVSTMIFKNNSFSSKRWKISSTSSASKTSLPPFSSPTSKPKTGFLDPKLWKILKKNTPKEPSFSTTSQTAQSNPLFTTQFPKHASSAKPLIRSSTCLQRNALTASKMKNWTWRKEFANQNRITQIFPKFLTGNLTVGICQKLTKLWLLVPLKNHISTGSFAFLAICLCTGVCLETFARNVMVVFRLTWTQETAKK